MSDYNPGDAAIPTHMREGRQLGAYLEIAARCGLSVREDLMEAIEPIGFDKDRCEWGLGVRGSVGLPRPLLGVVVITLKDDGEIVVLLE